MQISAKIEKVVFFNPDNGYTVLSVKTTEEQGLKVTCTIPFTLAEGQEIEIEGEVDTHSKYGKQFKASSVYIIEPSTAASVKAYLASGIIRGIGPATAERIVAMFGDKSLEVIDSNPKMLLQVSGIGEKTLAKIAASWIEKREGARIVAELCRVGLSFAYATKVYKEYGNNAPQVIQENPYRLADEVSGIGFKRADEIALKIGFDKNHMFRIESGVIYTLKHALGEGHCFLPGADMAKKAQEILDVPADRIDSAIDILLYKEKMVSASVNGTQAFYLSSAYNAEKYIEKKIRDLLGNKTETNHYKDKALIQKFNLADEQCAAIETALSSGVSVITGPAGSGKTTTLQTIIACFKENNLKYFLCAPTGKAAKRITEVTGEEASTIHRLIGYSPEMGVKRDKANPLECNYVVCDEASMIDIFLFADLLRAVPDTGRLILIGDPFQLPPVGAGLAFRDIISSGVCPVAELKTIHRQKGNSSIVDVANDIKNGKFPHITNDKKGETFFFTLKEQGDIALKIVELATKKIPETFGIPFEEIQVIAPMKKEEIGTVILNQMLQKAVQPEGAPALKGFIKGDKVMQTVNNYEKNVFNGETGRVESIDMEERIVTVNYDIGLIPYEFHELDEIMLAYAVTCHKYQGSQSRAVILPLHNSQYIMLRRDLLYTAVTRGQELVVLVGSKQAMAIAVKNNKEQERNTGLFGILKSTGQLDKGPHLHTLMPSRF
ncbi:MAG: ATP-dependent RecD-like DNA helicase [Syntrophomonadaceae bacterium]|nr:ATP-dependent RecD-like DNA helicase [Bacillota bacterium]